MYLFAPCTLLSLAGLAFLCQNASAAPSQQVPKVRGEVHLDFSETLYNISTLNLSSNEVPFQGRVPLPDQQNLNTTLKANLTVAQALDSTKTSPNVGLTTTTWPVTSDFYLSLSISANALPEASVDTLLSRAYRTAEKRPSGGLLTEKYEQRIRSRWVRALDIILDVDPLVGTMTWEDFALAMTGLWEFYHRAEDPPPQYTVVYFDVESRSRGPLGLGSLCHGLSSLSPAYGAADRTVSNASLTS